MFGSNKDMNGNLNDIAKDTLKDSLSVSVSNKKTGFVPNDYPKLNKLITGLYMVTDIIDKDEPIRLKLRTLGVQILSDINSASRSELNDKIQMILSFLDIALAIGLVSEMNSNILKKEFVELSQSFRSTEEQNQVSPLWLEEFLKEEKTDSLVPSKLGTLPLNRVRENTPDISRKQRRDEILKAIRDNAGMATITEIRHRASGSLLSSSEKTLQRELLSMVKDGLINKTGEKRWSRYSLLL